MLIALIELYIYIYIHLLLQIFILYILEKDNYNIIFFKNLKSINQILINT